MSRYSLAHLSDSTLLRDLASLVARDRHTTAELLAHIAEVDARKLYAGAAYPSMFSYCVGELRLSEDAAAKRIQAARVALRYPRIFELLADGRLNLSAVVLVAPRLRGDNADSLLDAAIHRTCSEIEHLLAGRFPRPDVGQPVIELTIGEYAARHVDSTQVVANTPSELCVPSIEPDPGPPVSLPPARLKPIAPGLYSLQVPIDQQTHDRLRHAQALLSHRVPSGDLSQLLDRALAALIGQLEKRKLGATPRPRRPQASANPRHIPAHVRRAVWERDGGQCTFVSAEGRRCAERRLIEFDHEIEIARGGTTSVGNLRLRCRTHNQHTAEGTFGTEFMRRKRKEAAAIREPARRAPREAAPAPVAPEPTEADLDVVPWLRALGIRADEARDVARRCVHGAGDTLEQRVRRALSFVGPRARRSAASPLPV